MIRRSKNAAKRQGEKSARAAALASGAALTLVVLGLGQFINAYDSTSMNVALSNIVRDLHTTVSGVQSAIAAYTLVMAAFMVTGSKIADIIGRKRAFVIGVVTYGAGALTTALSPNLAVMMFGWSLVEGIGACLMTPAIYTLIAANFKDGKARTTAYGVVGAMVAVGAAMGPIICGFLTTVLTWRVSFAMEVFIVLFIVSQSKRIADAPLEGEKPKLDVIGVILSALGLGTTIFGVLMAGRYGWSTARHDMRLGDVVLFHKGGVSPVPVIMGIGIAAVIAFVIWEFLREKRGKTPLVHPGLFRNRVFTLGLVNSMTSSFGEAGMLITIPIFLQVSLGYNALETGLTLLPLMLSVVAVSRAAGRLAERRSPRALALVGFLLMFAGLVVATFTIRSEASGWSFVPSMLLFGAGIGILFPQYTNLVMSSAPPDQQSEASGLTRSFSNLGMSIGTAVAGTVLIAGLIASTSAQVTKSTILPGKAKQEIDSKLEGNVQAISNEQLDKYLKGVDPAVADEVIRINEKARNKGMRLAIIVVGILSMSGFIASFWLPGRKRKGPLPETTASG
jgi:EmrB/QacA subfamily drug resistance transporter